MVVQSGGPLWRCRPGKGGCRNSAHGSTAGNTRCSGRYHPASLALAQGAIESAYALSRFAVEAMRCLVNGAMARVSNPKRSARRWVITGSRASKRRSIQFVATRRISTRIRPIRSFGIAYGCTQCRNHPSWSGARRGVDSLLRTARGVC